MSNCEVCGRKTQIIQKGILKTGKRVGQTKLVHRCELHGNFTLYIVSKDKKGVDS